MRRAVNISGNEFFGASGHGHSKQVVVTQSRSAGSRTLNQKPASVGARARESKFLSLLYEYRLSWSPAQRLPINPPFLVAVRGKDDFTAIRRPSVWVFNTFCQAQMPWRGNPGAGCFDISNIYALFKGPLRKDETLAIRSRRSVNNAEPAVVCKLYWL